MDGATIAILGHLLAFAGDWERGVRLVGRAMAAQPASSRWYWCARFFDAYRKGDYRDALGFALKVQHAAALF